MRKVMVLEDESSIRSFIVINLRRAGYEVVEAETGEEALDKLHENPDTLVALLDVMLPGIDGFEVCRRIRATNPRIGIIMLTARSQEMDKVTGLMTGADDYVTKPFGVMELLSRVRAVLRRTGSGEEPAPLCYGGVSLDPGRRAVTAAGGQVALTYKEFELLAFLLKNQGLVLTREKIMERVWGFDYEGESRTVDMHIKSLRHKLGACGEIIRTVRGVGYKIGE